VIQSLKNISMNIIDQLAEQQTLNEMLQTCSDATGGNDNCILHADNFNELKKVSNACVVLHRVANSQGRLFFVASEKNGAVSSLKIRPTQCGRGLLELIFQRVVDIPDQYPKHSFSAEVLIFKKVMEQLGLADLQRYELSFICMEVANTICDGLNTCVDAIRAALNAPTFKAQRRKHTKASLKNQRGGYRWLHHLLNRYARLCAIRIDLTYAKQYQCESADMHAVTVKESFAHRERFLRQLPKWINDRALLGYMLKTEYTLKRSIHHHALIILDGSKLCSDISIADLLGQKWAGEITQGRGSFRNVNLHTDKASSTCGVGDVYAYDMHKIHNLKTQVISYLSKPDHLVRWLVSNKHRLFLKSVTKPPATNKRGRPRTTVPKLITTPTDADLTLTTSKCQKSAPVDQILETTAC
jgi:hypothetical protein